MAELDMLGWSLGAWVLGISAWTGIVYLCARGLDAATARVVGPRIRILLYAAVLVRLLLPLDFSTPVGLGGRLGSDRVVASIDPSDPTAARAEPSAREYAAATEGLAPPEIPVGVASASAAVESPEVRGYEPTLGLAIVAIYALGVVACLGLWLGRWRGVAGLVAQSRPLARMDRVELREHPRAGPFAHGLRRRVIVLPTWLRHRLEPEVHARLLAHERAHHQHGDPWLVAALMAVAALAWPVIPVWLTLRQVRRLIEEAADARALAGAGDALRRAYGKALVELASAAPSPSSLPALGGFAQLESRISSLVVPVRTPRLAQVCLGVGLSAALAACMAVGDAEQPAGERELGSCDELLVEATTRHDDAQKSASEAIYAEALAAYAEFLDTCPDHPDRVDALYYAGEAHWALAAQTGDLAQFRAAPTSFQEVLEHDGDYRHDAAYGQLLSTLNALAWDDERPPPACTGEDCDGFALLPYDADEQAVIASWERYVATLGRPLAAGGSPRAEQVRMAKLFMQHNDFEAARPELEELVGALTGPGAPAPDAGDVHVVSMYVDLLTIDWVDGRGEGIGPAEALRRGEILDAVLAELEGAALLELAEADELREAVTTLRVGVEWKRAMADTAAGEHQRCVERFEVLLDRHPDHPRRAELEANAAACRERAR